MNGDRRFNDSAHDGADMASTAPANDSQTPVAQAHLGAKTKTTRAVLYYREVERSRLQEIKRQCSACGFILLTETTGWDDALDLAKKRIVDVIVVSSFSSFPTLEDRPVSLALVHVEKELRDRGAVFFILSERIGLLTAFDRLMFSTMVAMDSYRRTIGSGY